MGATSLLLVACAYPTTSTTQGGTSSAIYFEAFPETAEVFVDGEFVGSVSQFDGSKQTLAVPTGTHAVLIRSNGTVLYDKKVYVGRDSALKISQ
jgi:hypothetical protein